MPSPVRGAPLLTISPPAAERLREMRPGGIPRVSVSRGGCAGMSWSMEQVPAPLPGDTSISQDGAELLVSQGAFLWLVGSTVDWRRSGFEEGFHFVGANEAARCGCGQSFTLGTAP